MQEAKTKTQPTQHGRDIDRHSNVVIRGHVVDVLSRLEDQSVHMVVTSPPYWGLRDYGTPDVIFSDGWSGTLGLEPDPQSFIFHMVEIFRAVWRVMRDDATLWLNIGDSYSCSPPGNKNYNSSNLKGIRSKKYQETLKAGHSTHKGTLVPSLKPKDMVGIPWRLAFALQADGWYLRSDIIWAKPNPMPESVTDRPTKSHEHIFLLSKSARYFYDQEAIKEKKADSTVTDSRTSEDGHRRDRQYPGSQSQGGTNLGGPDGSRNKRDVWTVPTHSYPDAHFATFPPKLIVPCILAGTSERGCCPECGTPWTRVVEKPKPPPEMFTKARRPADRRVASSPLGGDKGSGQKMQNWLDKNPAKTIDWRPGCACLDINPIPCTVLDPFSGAGTTGLVTLRHRRRYIGIELSDEYVDQSVRRIEGDQPLFNKVEVA